MPPTELDEIDRFQNDVRRTSVLSKEIRNGALFLPCRSDPRWLPLMQHYDEEFGTRMLDISSSIFAGLYFASVGWDGEIDTNHDGILYLFMRGTGLTARGYYYDQRSPDFDVEIDELAPKNLKSSFVDWPHPEYFRIYKSSTSSPRELAQDGWFLVRGVLNPKPQFGQGLSLESRRRQTRTQGLLNSRIHPARKTCNACLPGRNPFPGYNLLHKTWIHA